jgi:Zn-dependent peptidase ImmA (M78 family)
MTLPRGFKAYSQEVARDIRRELGMSSTEPLNPWRVADCLDIPCLPMSALAEDEPDAVRLLMWEEQAAFSGFVLCIGHRRAIVYNDAHATVRQRSDLAHELAHALLLHQPHAAMGGLVYDRGQEEQASWLGGVLLVPDSACVELCRHGWALAAAAEQMGVSRQLMQWRLNMSGARQRAERSRRRAA